MPNLRDLGEIEDRMAEIEDRMAEDAIAQEMRDEMRAEIDEEILRDIYAISEYSSFNELEEPEESELLEELLNREITQHA